MAGTLSLPALLIATCFSASLARMAFQLPAGVEDTFSFRFRDGGMDTSFTCDDKPYGFYADVNNDCEIFHVCNPAGVDEDGKWIATDHFTFVCGNETIFDQQSLVCATRDVAFPCGEAEALYRDSNFAFGRRLVDGELVEIGEGEQFVEFN